jgi:hypothetical protein
MEPARNLDSKASMQWYVRGPLDLEKAMAKEKSDGDKFSAIGKQTITRSYSAMDYYFDHLKKCIASAPSGGTELGEKVKARAEQNISATQEFRSGPKFRQGYPRHVTNSDGIHALAIGSFWRAG